MKAPEPPLFTFRFPNLHYSILLVADTAATSAEIKRQAKRQHQRLRDYCQGEILSALALAEFE